MRVSSALATTPGAGGHGAWFTDLGALLQRPAISLGRRQLLGPLTVSLLVLLSLNLRLITSPPCPEMAAHGSPGLAEPQLPVAAKAGGLSLQHPPRVVLCEADPAGMLARFRQGPLFPCSQKVPHTTRERQILARLRVPLPHDSSQLGPSEEECMPSCLWALALRIPLPGMPFLITLFSKTLPIPSLPGSPPGSFQSSQCLCCLLPSSAHQSLASPGFLVLCSAHPGPALSGGQK